MIKYLLAGIVAVLLVIYGFFGYGRLFPWGPDQTATTTIPIPVGEPFSETGNLVRNLPGMKSDTWYLSYEEPGKPGLLVELLISSSSTCISLQDIAEPCTTMVFEQGQRVTVAGSKEATIIRVSRITVQAASQPVSDLIRVTTPLPGARIESPLTIKGQARGTWYFEASFPITLIDANGRVLGSVAAQAQEDWMTTSSVPFVAKLPFSLPSTTTGSLVFEKDNPSGLPEHAAELRVPVRLATQETVVQLYYYNPAKDTDDAGNVLCSRKGLVAVPRRIIKTATPIQDAINELLKGQLTPQETARGVTTEFPLSGVSLKGADLKNGVLTLEFADLQNKTGGGSCRVGILWFQIEATAKQFAGVERVLFKPEELFQP